MHAIGPVQHDPSEAVTFRICGMDPRLLHSSTPAEVHSDCDAHSHGGCAPALITKSTAAKYFIATIT